MTLDDLKLKAVKQLVQLQGAEGNWNYSNYMMGMYNGMELMLSILEEREPEYKETPEKFIADEVIATSEEDIELS